MDEVLKTTPPTLTQERIRLWLQEKIAELLGTSAETVDVNRPFSFYGLDSVAALGLSGELEEWMGVKLPPTLTWDYPTVDAVARFLSSSTFDSIHNISTGS
jgi:acyl carrier protein